MQSYLSCQFFRLFNYLVTMNSECNGTPDLSGGINPLIELYRLSISHQYWEYHPGLQHSRRAGWGPCGPLPKTLIIFMTKIYDFCYAIYDLARNSILCLSTSFPGPIWAQGTRLSVYDRCYRHSCHLRQN